MIIRMIDFIFNTTGRTWKIGGKDMEPTEDDIKKALDGAAEYLYNENVGSTLDTGGLHIQKTTEGYDVYVYVGKYE